MNFPNRKALAWGLVGLVPVVCTTAYAQGAVTPEYRWLTFTVFAAIIALTMYVTYVASKRVKSASDFYTAGGGVTGLQNGWAIAGDAPGNGLAVNREALGQAMVRAGR